MNKIKLIYMDNQNEVRDITTQKVIFSTKLPEDLKEDIGRDVIQTNVINDVVSIWNNGGDVDDYLLNSGDCFQEEREIIVEALAIKYRLEELREELRQERISYGELVELQSLVEHIDPNDAELLQAAGIPEFPSKLKRVKLQSDSKDIHIGCPECDYQEQLGIDDPRKMLNELPIIAWYPDVDGRSEISVHKCSRCKTKFEIEWDYNNPIITGAR